MPKIACPKCNKIYNVPDQAVGQVATCKCGHKFRLGKRKSRSKPTPVVEVAEPTKTHDSFWDDALDEPVGGPDLAGAASMAEPEAPRPMAPVKRKTAKQKKKGAKEPWQFWLDVGFRIVAIITPFVIGWMTYQSFSQSEEYGVQKNAGVWSVALFLIALAVGGTLARYGIGFDRGSMKHRLTGLLLMLGGVLGIASGVGVAMALNYANGGGFAIIGGFTFGGIVFFIGMLQFISGRDLKSKAMATKNL